ncbi:MAG: anti-sigma factor [Actinomycetota bacterium]|nr:anti-sigma factor [Actinomycetota bacterium]
MNERRRDPNGHPPEEHSRARELLGPYVLGDLEPGEERVVERHVAECAACRDEERGLRETHEQLAGASIAASSVPLYLKERVLSALPTRDGSVTPINAKRRSFWFIPRVNRAVMAATMVLLIVVLPAVATSSGLFEHTRTATLTPTELASGAGGELEVRGVSSNVEVDLKVWDLPQPGSNGYYGLWFSRDGGRVSAGTFTVNPDGQGGISGSIPQLNGDFQRVDITLEELAEEPRSDSAKVVLSGRLPEP